MGLGCRSGDSGFRDQSLGVWVQGFGTWYHSSSFRVYGSGSFRF